MRKKKLKARVVTKSRVENDCLDFYTEIFQNDILNNFIEGKNSLRDLGIFNNQFL